MWVPITVVHTREAVTHACYELRPRCSDRPSLSASNKGSTAIQLFSYYFAMGDEHDGSSSSGGHDPPSPTAGDKPVELSVASLEAIAELVAKKLSGNPLKSPGAGEKDPPSDGKGHTSLVPTHTHARTHTRTHTCSSTQRGYAKRGRNSDSGEAYSHRGQLQSVTSLPNGTVAIGNRV